VRPLLGALTNGATTERLCRHVLALAQQPPSTTRRVA
jgi:hypothetical protein